MNSSEKTDSVAKGLAMTQGHNIAGDGAPVGWVKAGPRNGQMSLKEMNRRLSEQLRKGCSVGNFKQGANQRRKERADRARAKCVKKRPSSGHGP